MTQCWRSRTGSCRAYIAVVGLLFFVSFSAASAPAAERDDQPSIGFVSTELVGTADGDWRRTWLLANAPGDVQLTTEPAVQVSLVGQQAICSSSGEPTNQATAAIADSPLVVCYRAFRPISTQLLVRYTPDEESGSSESGFAVATLTLADDAFYTGALFTALMPVFLALLAGLLWPTIRQAVEQWQINRAHRSTLRLEYDQYVLALFKELDEVQIGLTDAATAVSQRRTPSLARLTHPRQKDAEDIATKFAKLTPRDMGQEMLASIAEFGHSLDSLYIQLERLASAPADSEDWAKASTAVQVCLDTLATLTARKRT